MEARGSPRRLSQCWAGSLNEKLRASGSAGLSYRFTDLFFSRHFLPNSLIALAHAMKLRRMEIFFLQFAASRQHPARVVASRTAETLTNRTTMFLPCNPTSRAKGSQPLARFFMARLRVRRIRSGERISRGASMGAFDRKFEPNNGRRDQFHLRFDRD